MAQNLRQYLLSRLNGLEVVQICCNPFCTVLRPRTKSQFGSQNMYCDFRKQFLLLKATLAYGEITYCAHAL